LRAGAFARRVVWKGASPPGVEFCEVRRNGSGWELTGTVARRPGGRLAVVSYLVETDASWRTSRAQVEVSGGKTRRLSLETRGARWFSGGNEVRNLRGCTDVDLQVSPATNTLPIKRAAPKVGSKLTLMAAWVRFPSLTVQPLRQTYERVSPQRYVYRSEGFSSEIVSTGSDWSRDTGNIGRQSSN
jgi:uncharacterized protein